MATYNGARYLAEQLASIESQAMPPSRMIVSDDGSADATRDILAKFAKSAKFDVLILDGPQQGYAENFWSAAKLADTKYIAWSDQDDVWDSRKISSCVRALEETRASFVSHSARVVDSDLRPLGRSLPNYGRTRVLRALQGDPFHVPSGFASVFKRELLDEIDWSNRPSSHQHPGERQLPHDNAVALIAFALHSRVQLRDPLASYRQHSSNAQGDYTVTGLGRQISVARTVQADDYLRLANHAAGYADYLALLSGPDTASVRFFRGAAERARLRAKVRNGASVPVRLHAFLESVAAGNYYPKGRGGFGVPALANDGLALGLSVVGGSGK
jgi:glycosyltransferase involved in cell wall biosynthesis